MELPLLKNTDVTGKKVLIRTGFDVPIDDKGNIVDDSRIKIAIPTIKYLIEHKVKKIIILFHFGRPKNKEPHLKTNKVAIRLSKILKREIVKIDDFGENGLPDNKIIMLENIRFDKREKSKDSKERDLFGKQLSSLADIYVNEAFSNSHHDQASMTSIPKFIPGFVGLGIEKEIKTIINTIKNPTRPFVSIIGGIKAEKLNAVKNLINNVDKLLIGGALAFTILKSLGKKVGSTKVDNDGLESFKEILTEIKNNPKIILPTDAIIADKFSKDANAKVVSIDNIPLDWMALDIGPETAKRFAKEIKNSKTVIWNGPLGVFEFKKFSQGTKTIANAIAESKTTSIIGGGDSAAAIDNLNLKNKMTLVSSGGGASLKLFEGKSLVAIDALIKQ